MKSIDGKLNKLTFNHSGVSVNSNLFESRKLSQTRHRETRLERLEKNTKTLSNNKKNTKIKKKCVE